MEKDIKDLKATEKEVDEAIELADCVNHIIIKPKVCINVTISGLETGVAPTVR